MSTPFRESEVTIDGVPLSFAQVMTLRVALTSYLMELRENGLGDDTTGKAIAAGYLAHGHAVARMLSNPSPTSHNISNP